MPKKNEISVGSKVDIVVAERLKERARAKGVGVNHLLKEVIGRYLEGENDDGISEICFLYDIDRETLIKNVRFLFDSGKLFVRDGRLKWNPAAKNPDFFSLDDKVEEMGLSENEKDRLKKTIAASLDRIEGSDDTGNGAGV